MNSNNENYTQEELDNQANQLNENNDAYWQSRGADERPENWENDWQIMTMTNRLTPRHSLEAIDFLNLNNCQSHCTVHPEFRLHIPRRDTAQQDGLSQHTLWSLP